MFSPENCRVSWEASALLSPSCGIQHVRNPANTSHPDIAHNFQKDMGQLESFSLTDESRINHFSCANDTARVTPFKKVYLTVREQLESSLVSLICSLLQSLGLFVKDRVLPHSLGWLSLTTLLPVPSQC